MSEAQWASHFRQRHGFEVNPSSVHDRRKAWPIFAGWVNAGLMLERVDAAVAQAIAQATEPIAYLTGYVDRVIASQATQKPSATTARDQERADVIATLTGRKQPMNAPLKPSMLQPDASTDWPETAVPEAWIDACLPA